MMKHTNIFTFSLLLVVTSIVLPFGAQAEDLPSQSSNIFKFQHKLAESGNVNAQYKLASKYEMGDGVTASIEQAKHWYGRAADAGSKPAMHRNGYLEVKEKGYDPSKDADWLTSVKSDAKARNAEAMLLLGQLYGEGIGVKKDLEKSLELLKQVRILGVANVENQIAMIEGEIEAINKAEQIQLERDRLERARLRQAKAEQKAASSEELAKQKAEAAKLAQAEKIRRYEKAMMQLELEQKKIDEQQAWATGVDGQDAVDDEI